MLTKVQIWKALACKYAEELIAVVTTAGIERTKNEARAKAYMVEKVDYEMERRCWRKRRATSNSAMWSTISR